MNKHKWLAALILLAITIPAHIVGIDKFATIDEPWWVISGSNYYYALTHKDFANTVYDYHPAVTTTWVVTAGMVSYFPEYRKLNQGYFDVRKPLFENFMREQGRDSLPLLRDSRLFQSALIIVLALLSFFLLQLLVDYKIAFLSIALAMNAPFFLGHSRLLNHEGMLAMFALVSLLGMLAYLKPSTTEVTEKKNLKISVTSVISVVNAFKSRNISYLLISGAAFGLAQLTKSSSLVIVPLVGLILFVGLFKRDEKSFASKFWGAVKIFAAWLATAAFVYVLLWPGMWVAPQKMIYEIYGNALSYAFQGARLDVTQELQPQSFSLATGYAGIMSYVNRWLISSTPISWLGLIFATLALFSASPAPFRSTITYLTILATLFILMFGIAQGRDSAHYILTSFVCLDIIAGLGWGYVLERGQKYLNTKDTKYTKGEREERSSSKQTFVTFVYFVFKKFPALAIIALLAFQFASALPHYPYYYTYQNPLASGSFRGYGEGLDQAATYLNQKPNAKDMRVIAYAARGCFSYFFSGRSDLLKIGIMNDLPFVEEIQSADYLVIYPIRQKEKPEGLALIRVLDAAIPEHIVIIDGIEYARIYKVAELPADVYNILAK